MSKMIQIRNVPDALHRRLKARAAEARMSLSDYLLTELRRLAERPSPEQFWERLRSRAPVAPDPPVVEALRQERDERDAR
jgi:antitoxin FitA